MAVRPLMLGDCACCIHKETCRYEGIAKYLKERFDECMLEHNPFTLKCGKFSDNLDRVIYKENTVMLKSIDRINRMINDGRIKRIYIFDIWQTAFIRKIEQLFKNKVEVCIIRNNQRSIDRIRFNEHDCILFYETIINDKGKAKEIVLQQAGISNAYVKVLTEDILDIEVGD